MENVFSTLRPEQIPSLNDKERWYCFGWSTINKAQPNLKSGDMDSYPGPKLSLWRFYQCKVSDSRRLFYHLSAELLSIEFIWTKTKATEKASKSVGKRHKRPIYGDLKRKKKSNCIKRGKTWVNKSLLVLVVYLIGWESNAGFFFFFLDQSQNVTAKPKYVLLDRFRHSNETFSNHLLFNFHSHLLISYYFFFNLGNFSYN